MNSPRSTKNDPEFDFTRTNTAMLAKSFLKAEKNICCEEVISSMIVS